MKLTKEQELIEISYSKYDGYQVSYSNNGIQWNTIYSSQEFKNATIILDAFSAVGYKDVSDYKLLDSHFKQLKSGDKE